MCTIKSIKVGVETPSPCTGEDDTQQSHFDPTTCKSKKKDGSSVTKYLSDFQGLVDLAGSHSK